MNYTFEEELGERTIAGTPAEVVDGLGRYTDDFGVNVFDLFVLWPSADRQAVRDHLAFIGSEVLAPLRAHATQGRRRSRVAAGRAWQIAGGR